MFHYSS